MSGLACPICQRPSARPNEPSSPHPFCSARCRAVDLGRWFTEAYRIPGPPVEREDGTPPEDLDA
ncbi:MAG: DNA gyrase inhibitor YacG [Polyangiales bacterium]